MLGSARRQGFPPLFDDRVPTTGRADASSGLLHRRGEANLPAQHDAARHATGVVARSLDGVGGLGWSILGFVGGAVFWHFVGFWSFVSDVVLSGGTEPPVSARTLTHSVPAGFSSNEVQAQIPASAAVHHGCTLLFLDRQSGRTTARACDAHDYALPQDTVAGREDRLTSAAKSR